MHVVATAGHVDHGKSTLVHALTGQQPDRLAEERRRGLSIELGYCWTDLPPVGEVAFVDVPGHERFLTTTLAGLGPAPAAMLVVAADDPWMPQAAEHLAALDALGVRQGVLVVTRCDLADPGPVLDRARREVGRTSLAGVPSVVVSGRTGEGMDRLRRVLASVLAEVPRARPSEDVRLWVDRRFHVRGSGTVVTGTLVSGTVAPGDVLAVEDVPVRVRSLEALGTARERVTAPARVAVDLGGRAPEVVGRGRALLTPHAFHHSSLVDVSVREDEGVPGRPTLHVGTAAAGVRARRLGRGFWRLALDRPLPLRTGDHGILRDPGSRRLWGARVVDPDPPALHRRGAAAARARTLAAADGSAADELARRGVVRASRLRALGVTVDRLPEGVVTAGDWLVDGELAGRLRRRLTELTEAATATGGLAPAAAAHALDLPDPALVGALAAPPVRLEQGRLRAGRPPGLPVPATRAVERLAAELRDTPFAAPEAGRLPELGLDDETVTTLHRAGLVVRLAPGVVLLPAAVETAAERLARLDQPFTVSEARRALGTTRRVALPLLAHLDACGRTLRLPDDRRRARGNRPGATGYRRGVP